MSLLLTASTVALEQFTCRAMETFQLSSLHKSGDIMIGGIFEVSFRTVIQELSFTSKPGQWVCEDFDITLFQTAQALVFAVEEINNDTQLLPNVTLGYTLYDNCMRLPVALRGASALTLGMKEDITENCKGPPPVLAIVGDPTSTHSIAISRILSLFRIPMVSYFATCPCLSDKWEYPSFFRTIPSDTFQIKVISAIFKHYGWTWVGIIAADDDYGQSAIKALSEEIKDFACIAFSITIPKINDIDKVRHVTKIIKESSAKVIVVFSPAPDFSTLADEINQQNIIGRQWIASESWSNSYDLFDKYNFSTFGGTLGITIHNGEMPGFQSFLYEVQPTSDPKNNLILQFWETMFDCKFKENTNEQNFTSLLEGKECTGKEDIKGTKTAYTDVSKLRACYNIYKAVYAIAHALHNLLTCENGNGPFVNKSCADITNMQPWQIPESVCSKSCQPGTRKATREREPVCCFDCVQCAAGEISTQVDAVECIKCPIEFWSNVGRNECVPKEIEFLSFEDSMGITLTATAASGVCLSVIVLSVFIHYRHTPVVKANNSELSFLLLVSLTLCFLCSLCFIGHPTELTCKLRHILFGISFVLCISCILVKTIVVIMAFKATLPGNNIMKWFGVIQQRSTVFFFTFIQGLICIIWLTASPPLPAKNIQYQNSKIIFECDVGSVTGFSCLLGYIGLLTCISFLLAFLARNLPDTFNEAKFITFSMLIFCAVWITFIPAYISSPGKYTVAVEIFAILASSFGLLFAIFAPKCFIILIRPELNTKKALMGRDSEKQI
ncbi:extracellular calcium-sensing receptor-like isoform X2 [Erpetoichthys calabaricus]|uniref:extracellular calcium-sensing receptor-like isoform X2 n=1 Tax=Erpetoichthys calabaricus TaxID=27687 RepID=UPI00223442E8|nr:extracellular calcium-sensing receptor-like isoform X2 [Erpetoichthys calabaricus]